MGLLATDKGGVDFPVAPIGNHIGRCYSIIDMGMQKTTWMEEVKWKHKVRLAFELPNVLMEEGESAGQPFSVSNNYTLSLNKNANLRGDLEAWRSKPFSQEELDGFDIFNVIGKTCMINVVHNVSNDRTYANIASLAPMMAELTCPPAVNTPLTFCISDATEEEFNALPEWVRNKINRPPADQALKLVDTPADIADDDIPF